MKETEYLTSGTNPESGESEPVVQETIEVEVSSEEFVERANEEVRQFKEETAIELGKLNIVGLDPESFNKIKEESGIVNVLGQIDAEVEEIVQNAIIEARGNSTKESTVEKTEENYIPLPGETSEEFASRFQVLLTDKYIKDNPNIQNQNPLITRAYYGNYTNQALNNFYNSDQQRNKFMATLHGIQENENVRQSPEKDEKTLKMIERMISISSKDSATGEDTEKIDYYAKTNQTRQFLEKGRKRDSHSYAHMMFGLPDKFVNTPQGLAMLHEKVDDKSIFLFGGGESIHDLLTSGEFHPKSVTNFDPYIKSELIDRNVNNIYRSEDISAADPAISKKVERGEIPKADEIWMTYSVPFYLDNSEEIKSLMDNITSTLNEGGTARMSPIMLQDTETDGENFETRKQALLGSLRNLTDSEDYNITVFDDTIKIHKIKKPQQNPETEK